METHELPAPEAHNFSKISDRSKVGPEPQTTKDDPGKNDVNSIYINHSADEFVKSSSNLEIPPPENIVGYSIASCDTFWSPTNGPNISELFLNNESLNVPNLHINPTAYFLPVLKKFTVHLEASSNNQIRNNKTVGKNISRIFKVLEAPQLEHFEFQDDLKVNSRKLKLWKGEKNPCWDRPLVNFVKNHCVSLKRISVIAWKCSVAPDFNFFPELEELSIGFWGYETKDHLSPKNNFWVALLRSQKTQLRKLKWCVSCSMSWEDIVVPVITRNFSTLESVQMLLPIVAIDTERGRKSREANFIFSIDCGLFSNVTQLKILQLGWQFCFIHNLQCLPASLQDFSLFSMPVQTCELFHLRNLPQLKQLDLISPECSFCQLNVIVDIISKEDYGVTPSVLKYLLTNRSLMKITATLFPDSTLAVDNDQATHVKIHGEDLDRRKWSFLFRNWFRDERYTKGEDFHPDLSNLLEATASIDLISGFHQIEPIDADISDVIIKHLTGNRNTYKHNFNVR